MPLEFSDPMHALRLAREALANGESERALEAYEWFYANSVALDPTCAGVRATLALRRWAELGAVYSPALDALRRARDEKAKILRDSAWASVSAFTDVEAISHVLRDLGATSELFVQMAAHNRAAAKSCFTVAMPALVQAKKFTLARSFLNTPEDLIVRSALDLASNLDALPAVTDPSYSILRDAYLGAYAEDVCNCLAIISGSGDPLYARVLRESSLRRIENPELRTELDARFQMLLEKMGAGAP